MPLLTVKTSVTRPAAAKVESLLLEISGRIARHLGKPEAYVMTAFEGAVPMTFAGTTTEPVCYLELKSVGKLSPATTKAISDDRCALIKRRHVRVRVSRQDPAALPLSLPAHGEFRVLLQGELFDELHLQLFSCPTSTAN